MPKYILQQVVSRKPKQEGNYETHKKLQQQQQQKLYNKPLALVKKQKSHKKNFYKMWAPVTSFRSPFSFSDRECANSFWLFCLARLTFYNVHIL